MPLIAHRINTVERLKEVPAHVGVEIDVRFDTRTGEPYLCHDNAGPGGIEGCDTLARFLDAFEPRPGRIVVFNVKDTGTEETCRALAAERGISPDDYFLLDVEFPYVFAATRRGVSQIAIRYSEAEPIEQLLHFTRGDAGPKVDWVWIDTNTTLPLDRGVIRDLRGVRSCLVCPERWGRPHDIPVYVERTRELGYCYDAVMTALPNLGEWERSGVVKGV